VAKPTLQAPRSHAKPVRCEAIDCDIPHDLAGELIDWQPQVKMKEGIRRLLAWREEQEKK
jgi:nucleoside-diphosphate-sugar epimerase